MDAMVVLGQQGRPAIPAPVGAARGMAPTDHLHLVLVLVGQRVVLERPLGAVKELRGLADVSMSRSLVDELLAGVEHCGVREVAPDAGRRDS